MHLERQLRLMSPVLAAILLLAISAHSENHQTDSNHFPILAGPYLGQTPPGRTPQMFAPGIVSSGDCNEYICVFSPDGQECVFDRHCNSGSSDGAILVSRLIDGKWTEPKPHELFTRYAAFQPSVAPDGKRWFFTSWSLPVPDGARGVLPLYYIDKVDSGWSEPVYFAEGIHASATVDGTVFHDGATADGNSHPVFRIPEKGTYSAPQYVEDGVSFGTDDAHGIVSPDGSYLIFDCDKRPRVGDCMLFVSFKGPDGRWTEPVSMGTVIKQKAAIAWVTTDGKYIFFKAEGDIYWVDAKIIEELK